MAGTFEQTRKGNAVLEQLGGRPVERQLEDSVRPAFEERSRQADDDLTLEVCLSDGARCSFSWSYFVKVHFDPGDKLMVHFGLDTVVIEGRRLLPLYNLIRRHRAKAVQEGTTAEDDFKPEEASHIDRIKFEKGEEKA